MAFPDHQRLVRVVERPVVDFELACGGEAGVVLPDDVDDFARLRQLVHRLLDDRGRVPDKQARVLAAGSDECITLVPGAADEPVLAAEQALELSLHVPDARNVVVGARQQLVAGV